MTANEGSGLVTATYDYNNKPLTVTDALNNKVEYTYDPLGNPLTYKTARGNVYTYEYDGNGNLTKETDPLGGIVEYGYNAYNTATSFKDANNNNTAYTYDLLNRLTAETSADGESDSYTYNAISQLTKYTNKRGQSVEYTYDADGNTTGRKTPGDVVLYTYDANGNLLTIEDENGTITRTYDNLNRVTSYTNAQGQTIGYEYDSVGNLTKLTYPDGKAVTYTYNSVNQMTSVMDWNNRTTYYTYDNSGNLQKIVRPDGSQEVYNYDAKGQLLTVTDSYANGNTINQYYFTYDADGNIISETSFNEPDASEISIDSAEMSYGAANQLTNFNGTAIAYDSDGNALSTPLGDAWGNLTYDSLNQLTDVTISGSAVSYGYTYDAEGNRIAKTEKGVTTTYVVDTNSALSQVLMSTENGETTYYVYGLGLISQENSYEYRLFHYDYRGSTTTITNLNGEVTDTLYYDPYGNIISRTGTTDTPFLYVGQYGVETDDSGLYYMRARYYNPQIQRFINVDPVSDGFNWYSYTDGNPINRVDYSGYSWKDSIIGIISSIDDNVFFGIPQKLADYSYTNDYELNASNEEKNDFYWGRVFGDAASFAAGGVAMVGGMNMILGGLGLTGGASVGMVATGGLGSPVFAPAASTGIAIVGAGASVAAAGAGISISAIESSGNNFDKINQIKANLNNNGGSLSGIEKAKEIAKKIKNNNMTPPKDYRGGRTYYNNPRFGGQKLPEGVNYREYDINPYTKGVNRGPERIVIGDDGSVWYTSDHYQTFIRIE